MIQKKELDELYFTALEAEESGDFTKSFNLFMQGATLGDAAAQNAVGLAYDRGRGVDKDKDKAIVWFKRAWRTGKEPYTCGNIALTYAETGRRRRAVFWWQKAIALGYGSAAFDLAKFLEKSEPGQVSNKILDLLRIAATCQEPWQISPHEREEAEALLETLTSKRQRPAEADRLRL